MTTNAKIFLLFSILLLPGMFSHAQPVYQTPFVAPVDIPLYLSGTFGELRSDHFHSGIDIKTQGKEGIKIKAIESGWVSRIKISAGGYGKALYITHPNGFVSVYAHLKYFNDTIESYVRKLQYERESFEIETFPNQNELPVKQGETIAWSGNTGSSMGPHLHFEIREEASQHTINPLLFNSFKVKDFYRPKIVEMAIYPADSHAFINGKQDTLFIPVAGWGAQHRLDYTGQIRVQGLVAFGLLTHDVMNEIPNKNGVYEVKLFQDTVQVFGYKQDKLSFATSRYINSLIDYQTLVRQKKRFIRTEIDTNNLFRNYTQVAGNGLYLISDTTKNDFTWEVDDVYGNTSTLKFTLTGDTTTCAPKKLTTKTPYYIKVSEPRTISTERAEITIPANATYRSFYFDLKESKPDSNAYSATFMIHNPEIPLQKSITIRIKPNSLPAKMNDHDRLYLAYSPKGKSYAYAGGKMEDGWMKASTRKFGYYKIKRDTTRPEIRLNKIKLATSHGKGQILSATISDKNTGVATYRATLNGQWILMEYDAKKNLLFYEIDERMKAGKNNFTLEVTDNVGNKAELTAVIERLGSVFVTTVK